MRTSESSNRPDTTLPLHFREPTLADKPSIDACLCGSEAEGCGFSFGNLYLWRRAYAMTFCISDGFLFISSSLGLSRAFACPVGRGDLAAALDKVCAYAVAGGMHPVFYAVTERQRAAMERCFPGRFAFCDERDYYDYVYLTENLAALPGKKYHAKRNHISKFEKSHTWSFERIDSRNLSDCKIILDAWLADKFPDAAADTSLEGYAESQVAKESIEQFFALGYEGGILYADGKPAAYSMGEPLNDETFCTHIEKASPEFRDAYALINRETAKSLSGRFTYINREDDAGDEGLRKAKLSYVPDILLVKYVASENRHD